MAAEIHLSRSTRTRMELAKNSQIKQLLIALMVGLFCLSAKAQSDTIVRVEDRYDDKLILEFTNDMWLDLPEGVELRPVSIGFKGHFYSDYTFGRRSNVSF